MRIFTLRTRDISARITSPYDPLRLVVLAAAAVLAGLAAALRPAAVAPAAGATLGPFATLAAIIAGSVLAGRLGVFRLAARLLIPPGHPAPPPRPRSWPSPPCSARWPTST